MGRRIFFIAPVAVLGLAAFVAVGGGIVMWLWNALLPSLFGGHTVTFWQAVGLLALSRILFGGFGFRGSRGGGWRRRDGRWERMTPEDRERFRHGLRSCFGSEPRGSEGPGE
jgi:hypothetical protein